VSYPGSGGLSADAGIKWKTIRLPDAKLLHLDAELTRGLPPGVSGSGPCESGGVYQGVAIA
jgi:hypothetical protein